MLYPFYFIIIFHLTISIVNNLRLVDTMYNICIVNYNSFMMLTTNESHKNYLTPM